MKRLAVILYTVFLFMGMTCSFSWAEGAIRVVSTIGQITNAVEIIGGDRVQVEGLMGAGVDPHLYKASESDVTKIAKADIIFYNGLYLEAKLDEIFKQMARSKKTVALAERIPVNERLDSLQFEGHYDPHVWFDVPLWRNIVEGIAETLSIYDPDHKDEYQSRAQEYLTELSNLHQYVEGRAGELAEDQRILVTAHDAFRYFGRRYGFHVVGLQGISTESAAGTKDVIELAEYITEHKIPAIFVESSVPVRNIQAVQEAVRARGWDVKIGGELFSDAMGTQGTFEGTYLGMIRHNIDTIVNALKEP